MSAETIGRQVAGMVAPAWAPSEREREWDIEVAATRGVPVLICAGPAESQAFASQLSRRSGSPRPAVRIVDCRQADAEGALRSLSRSHNRSYAAEILLLLEVHALSEDGQALLENQLEDALLHPGACSPVRLLASSSVPLFDRVIRQAFRERLYYLLNMIHIELPSESRQGSGTRSAELQLPDSGG